MELEQYLREKKTLVEKALGEYLPAPSGPAARLRESMRYSVLAGGKRLRPILCLATVEVLGGELRSAMPAACALEMIHTYSLIHDDLPCMDDDDTRRGRPANHVVFGEATALLAGDALIPLAFELVASLEGYPAEVPLEMTRLLARCCGAEGLVGGQAADLESEGRDVSKEELDYIHSRKTATLIETSVLFGAVLGGAVGKEREALSTYGRSLGMAFQITDDILDVEGEEGRMGKRLRKDAAARKATFPALYGIEESREAARSFIERAVAALDLFGEEADPLRSIARSVLARTK